MFNLNFEGRTFDDVFPEILKALTDTAGVRGSRNGRVAELPMARIHLTDPSFNPYVTTPGRGVQLPAQIAETVWVLSGRDDIKFIEPFLPRAKDYSDDGETWRGAYGPRLRNWGADGVDQLHRVAKLLHDTPDTRRAVIQIFDPSFDDVSGDSKDIPCNNWISFIRTEGKVHAHVAVRSNDAFWGLSGINAFEWTFLLQAVAFLAGMEPGSLTFSTTSLHLYEPHWERARRIAKRQAGFTSNFARDLSKEAPAAAKWLGDRKTLWEELAVSSFTDRWNALFWGLKRIEALIEVLVDPSVSDAAKNQAFDSHQNEQRFDVFRLWASEIWSFTTRRWSTPAHAWSGDNASFCIAALESPWRRKAEREDKAPAPAPADEQPAAATSTSFEQFVDALHREKNDAYGDSWMRRGESVGILANVARKVDRLGRPGAGDNELDTRVDLLLYLLKYQLWLQVRSGYAPEQVLHGDVHHDKVMKQLAIAKSGDAALRGSKSPLESASEEGLIKEVGLKFEKLLAAVDDGAKRKYVSLRVEYLISAAYRLAKKQHRRESLKTKQFTGYDV